MRQDGAEEEAPLATKRRPGEGSVDELPSGKWRVRMTDPEGNRRTAVFSTREQAEGFRLGVLAEYAQDPSIGVTTLASYGKEWLDAREIAGRHRGIATERGVWRTHVEGTELASMGLRSIERRHVKAWLAALVKKKALLPVRGGEAIPSTRPLSRSVMHQALVLVRGCLAAALDEERVPENPARDVKLPRATGTTSEAFEFLSVEEIECVVSSEKIPEGARLLYQVAIYTGLRQGELWGLHWSDVHTEGERPELVVRFSHLGPTKSGKVRRVPLFAPAVAALSRWRPLCPKTAEGYVFPSPRGERRKKSDDAGWGDRAIAKKERREGGPTVRPGHKTLVGIERRVTFHALRHTAASHLVMGTWGRVWKLDEVRDFLGHSSIAVTQIYAHLSPEHLHRAASETARHGHGVGHGNRGPSLETPISTAHPRGLEPLTSRSVVLDASKSSETLTFLRDHAVTESLARQVLEAASEADEVPGELVERFVLSILDGEVVQAALAAQEPGPTQLRRVLRLAATVLKVTDAYRAAKGGAW